MRSFLSVGISNSWDLGTGATDDGAGIAIAFGAARLIAGLPQRPSRTIRVVLFGAEEMNFSGAAYAQASLWFLHPNPSPTCSQAVIHFGKRSSTGWIAQASLKGTTSSSRGTPPEDNSTTLLSWPVTSSTHALTRSGPLILLDRPRWRQSVF